MKRLLATALLIVTAASAETVLRACGDKFLVNSRGTRFERAPGARQSAAILLYAESLSGATAKAANAPIQSVLRKAGYRPSAVESAAEFDRALSSGKWDVVVVDRSSATAVSSRVGSAAAVVALMLPAKRDVILDAVEDALASRRGSKVKAGN
jgi:hypothetical protein